MSVQDWDHLSTDERQQLVERLRQTGLSMDRDGRWWHEGSQVTHPGLARALNRWLDRLDDGRYVVRLDAERYAYVDIEDAPLIVRSLTVQEAPSNTNRRIFIWLSNEQHVELDYSSLKVGPDDALHCRIDERFTARFSRQAQQLMAPLIEHQDNEFLLNAGGRRWPISLA